MAASDEDEKTGQSQSRGYFGEIIQSAKSVFEGLAITFTELTRSPGNTTTVQYPDRTPIPVAQSLPERYRGFLEVDIDICTGCKACERDCPINVIAIDLEKIGADRMMTRFDIDLGKCMWCNICVESCPVDAQAPGDTEKTRCIRMTREFEGVVDNLNALTFRFIAPGRPAATFKPKKGETPSTRVRGEIAREVRAMARTYNPVATDWALAHGGSLPPAAAELVKEDVLLARAKDLSAQIEAIAAAVGPPIPQAGAPREKATADLIWAEALGQTDCGDCGHAGGCRQYARALATGRDVETWKCRPGGAEATRDINLILNLVRGKTVEEAAGEAAAVTLAHHRGQ